MTQSINSTQLNDAISDSVDATSDERLRLLETYSGRGMYGRQCLAFTASSMSSVTVALIRLATQYDEDVATNMAQCMCTDSFGKGIVAYFPGFIVGDNVDND